MQINSGEGTSETPSHELLERFKGLLASDKGNKDDLQIPIDDSDDSDSEEEGEKESILDRIKRTREQIQKVGINVEKIINRRRFKTWVQ